MKPGYKSESKAAKIYHKSIAVFNFRHGNIVANIPLLNVATGKSKSCIGVWKLKTVKCEHPEEDLIQTNGYRVLCTNCGRNTN